MDWMAVVVTAPVLIFFVITAVTIRLTIKRDHTVKGGKEVR